MSTVRRELERMLDRSLSDDPRAALIASRQLGEETEWLLQRAVALARREQWSWGRIGRLLGVSRQAARQRFSRTAPTVPPHRRADHQSEATLHNRESERMLRQMKAGTWQLDRGDDEVVAW